MQRLVRWWAGERRGDLGPMMLGTVALAAVALVVGVPSASSQVAPAVIARAVPAAGPLLAGNRVAWLQDDRNDTAVSVVLARLGDDGLIRTVLPKPPIPRHMHLVDTFGSGLIASPQYVGALRTVEIGDTAGVSSPNDDLLTAPLGDRFSHLPGDRCQAGGAGPGQASISGTAIAYLDAPPGCTTGNTVELIVRDLRHPRRSRVIAKTRTSPGLHGVRLAGRFVAWSYHTDAVDDHSAIALYDLASRRIVYRVTARRLGGFEIVGFALQADGKLAVAYGFPGRAVLAWIAPRGDRVHRLAGADPQAHPESSKADQTPVVMAGNRIAFLRQGALTVADLEGHRQIIRRFAAMRPEAGDFDFDGRRLVWAEQHITRMVVTCPPCPPHRPCSSQPCESMAIGPTLILSTAVR